MRNKIIADTIKALGQARAQMIHGESVRVPDRFGHMDQDEVELLAGFGQWFWNYGKDGFCPDCAPFASPEANCPDVPDFEVEHCDNCGRAQNDDQHVHN